MLDTIFRSDNICRLHKMSHKNLKKSGNMNPFASF